MIGIKKNIIIINGCGDNGKDIFIEYIKRDWGNNVVNFSMIDFIKDIAQEHVHCGYDKSLKNRILWGELKAAVDKYDTSISREYFLKRHSDFMKSDKEQIMFVHAREIEDIKWFMLLRDECPETYPIHTLYIDNKDKTIPGLRTDDEEILKSIKYDYYIDNNLNLINLYTQADKIYRNIVDGDTNK